MPSRLPDVDPNDFFALDLRVGRVTAVDEFPEARKPAWKLTVDFGSEVGELRTSAQITNYGRDELLGTKRIAGFTSEFLVLGAINPGDGSVHLLELPGTVAPGWRIA